ncbi:MAG: haloacid dehalogenase [Dehalococcoidia bacterium]|nr:haloacid dehalogenase [Dehalococcoidia bacterium]
MPDPSGKLDGIVNDAIARFQEKSRARERGLQISRGVIRLSANAIRAVHRREFDRASALLADAATLLTEANTVLADHFDIYYAGFIPDAQKEYAEARITLALIKGGVPPGPGELGIGDAPYLNGMGEVTGELRRYILDALRRGETDGCETMLGMMDDIYSLLVTVDFPDAMTGSLRRTTDSVRGILERTRGDVTMALVSQSLGAKLMDANKGG